VTVLRDADKALEPVDIKPIHWQVQDFALMHSRLGQQREYVVLRRWALRAIEPSD
jgi:2'-5' RNA ligase